MALKGRPTAVSSPAESQTPAMAQSAAVPTHEKESASTLPSSRPTASPGEQAAADKDFRDWLEKEAKDLDRTDVDEEDKKIVLKQRLAEMSPSQAVTLLETIKNPKSAAREKILSTYLLVEGGARTEAQLTALIVAPLVENQDYSPHSEDEMKGIREKSLRIMAIDGLFSRAQVDPSARQALARAASEAVDPTVRSYATNKLRQLR